MAPSYHRLGVVPAKRHVAFRAPDGQLYNEEVVGLDGGADGCHFVHLGGGRLESTFGVLKYRPGDYVVVPKGTTHRWVPDGAGNRHLVVETPGAIRLPRRYQNAEGQLLEHAPYWERDFRRP